MANEIKDKFSASAALNITLASLASSTSGVGRQSDLVDNTTSRYQRLLLYVKLKQGTSPTGSTACYIYLIRSDADGTSPHYTDGAGASDAAITILNAQLVGVLANTASPATGDVLYGEFVVDLPGPKWAIAVVNSTGAALNSTGSNSWARYVGVDPEVQ
ncbi:MAG TPA: hypothetical protein VHH73_16150 [Verrucomicrobiae bacterium]|nr:hypothetical protein [Verrucomicrobiae bacterium]